MKALIFAAGLGSRLRPFTDHHPKALAPVAGEPMLGRVITKLKNAGIRDFIVNVHHFSQQIIDYLRTNENFGVSIDISDESDKLLETGGGILAARHLLEGDDFIVHNADILTDFDISDMISRHKETHADSTLLVQHRQTRRYLVIDHSTHRMQGWTDIATGAVKPSSLKLTDKMDLCAFGGVHILSASTLEPLYDYASSVFRNEDKPKFSIMDFYIAKCNRLRLCTYSPECDYRWFDIGKPESLEAANMAFNGYK